MWKVGDDNVDDDGCNVFPKKSLKKQQKTGAKKTKQKHVPGVSNIFCLPIWLAGTLTHTHTQFCSQF